MEITRGWESRAEEVIYASIHASERLPPPRTPFFHATQRGKESFFGYRDSFSSRTRLRLAAARKLKCSFRRLLLLKFFFFLIYFWRDLFLSQDLPPNSQPDRWTDNPRGAAPRRGTFQPSRSPADRIGRSWSSPLVPGNEKVDINFFLF